MSGATAGAGDAPLRGQSLRTKASWPTGKVSGETRRGEVWARGVAVAQSPAPSVRAPRTTAPWRGGDAGTVALASLACRSGAVLALEPLPGRSGSAGSCGRSPGCLARGHPRGALSAPPRPAPPLPLAASSSSKFGGGSPAATLPCFAPSGAQAAPVRAGVRQAGRTGPETLATIAWTSALPGASSPRELSLWLLVPACSEAVAPPACSSRLPSPPPALPPASHRPSRTCTPPLRRTRPCAPPSPREAPLLPSIIPLLCFPLSPPLGSRAELSRAAAERNRLWLLGVSGNRVSVERSLLFRLPTPPTPQAPRPRSGGGARED